MTSLLDMDIEVLNKNLPCLDYFQPHRLTWPCITSPVVIQKKKFFDSNRKMILINLYARVLNIGK